MNRSWLIVALVALSACESPGRPSPDPSSSATMRLTAQPTVFVQAPWGAGPQALGHKLPEEGAPEGPMSLTVDVLGNVYVLDQVNERVQVYDPSGSLTSSIPIGSDTVQDLAVLENGNLVLLDRLADRSIRLIDPTGATLSRVPLEGHGVAEGGAVTALLAEPDGVYVEVNAESAIRLMDLDGRVDRNRRGFDGRPAIDGTAWRLRMADRLKGTASIGLVGKRGLLKSHRQLEFGLPIGHLAALEMDEQHRVYVGAYLARESPQPPFQVLEERFTMVVLSPSGHELARQDFEATGRPEEQFRPFTVSRDGTVYHLQCHAQGVVIRRWKP